MKKASICIIENEKGEILFLDRSKQPFGFGFVGGKVDEGESDYEACKREVFEESGIVLTDGARLIGTTESSRGNFELSIFYTKFPYTPIVTLSDEHKSYMWISDPDEAYTEQGISFVPKTHAIINMLNLFRK